MGNFPRPRPRREQRKDTEREIDARGSFSPGPLMELLRVVRGMLVGSVLAVVFSDPGSVRVIPPWIRKARHEFLGAFPEQGYAVRDA